MQIDDLLNAQATWYLCTVSRHEPGNWALCKDNGVWGFTGGASPAEPGDRLLFWLGGRGYVGYGVVSGPPRTPRNKSDAPWPGGTYRFTSVVPFKLLLESPTPLYLKFDGARQANTGFTTAHFQRGMARVPAESATPVVEQLFTLFLGGEEGDGLGEL